MIRQTADGPGWRGRRQGYGLFTEAWLIQEAARVRLRAVRACDVARPGSAVPRQPSVKTTLRGGGLCRWCLDKVPYFAVPRYIEFRDELPRNATGKVLKYQLRDEAVTPTTWDLEQSDLEVSKR